MGRSTVPLAQQGGRKGRQKNSHGGPETSQDWFSWYTQILLGCPTCGIALLLNCCITHIWSGSMLKNEAVLVLSAYKRKRENAEKMIVCNGLQGLWRVRFVLTICILYIHAYILRYQEQDREWLPIYAIWTNTIYLQSFKIQQIVKGIFF